MRVLIVRNNTNKKAMEASLVLHMYLSSQSIDFQVINSGEFPEGPYINPKDYLEEEPDFALALGGDGTILSTARLLHGMDTPLLGVNFGHLGFLANEGEGGIVEIVADAFAGELIEERRSKFIVDVLYEGDDPSDISCSDDVGERLGTSRFVGLNEVVLSNAVHGKIVELSYYIDGSFISQLRGDGLVVSTATGSTAYALSAGGPLLTPEYQGLVVVPLAPHTLRSRAIVTSKNDVVELVPDKGSKPEELAVSIDGRQLSLERPLERICVRVGESPTRLLRCGESPFYTHLSEVFFHSGD